ncbi:HAD family hydrolase [Phormidesmis priestleyi]
MTNTTEQLTQSANHNANVVLNEVNTPSIHPAVGVVGVSAIGGTLGAVVGGVLGALLGGVLGALSASVQNSKSVKSGYYATRSQSKPLPSLNQAIDRLATQADKARKELAQDVEDVGESVQQGASNLAAKTQETVNKLDSSYDVTQDSTHSTVKGILLDVDGTLVMSNDAHAQAWVESFADFGYEVAFENVRPLIGMGGDQVIPRLVSELSGKEGVGKQIADRRKELIMNKFGATLSPAPGSREFILKLKQEGFQLVVASSATGEELSVLLKAAQVDDLLEQEPITTSSDTESSKPAPDLVQAALKKGHLQPQQAIMFGDTPYDIEAANKAGVQVIAFRTGGFDDSQLAGALEIYDSPADFLAHYDLFELPARGRSLVAQHQTVPISSSYP